MLDFCWASYYLELCSIQHFYKDSPLWRWKHTGGQRAGQRLDRWWTTWWRSECRLISLQRWLGQTCWHRSFENSKQYLSENKRGEKETLGEREGREGKAGKKRRREEDSQAGGKEEGRKAIMLGERSSCLLAYFRLAASETLFLTDPVQLKKQVLEKGEESIFWALHAF